MPLRKSTGRDAFVSNLKAELNAGKPRDQALAIAYAVKRRARSRADGGDVSFDDRFIGEPYRETADDLAARARNLVRSQPDRMRDVVPDKTDEVGGPLIGDGGQFSPGIPAVNRFVDRVAARTASLPRAMVEGAVHDVSTPGAAMQQNPYPEGSEGWYWYEDQRDKAATQWGPSMALNMVGSGAPFAQPSAVGIMGGRLAKTADHAALAWAEEMHAAGARPEQIHAETGWFQGADGQWRFEINDRGADFPGGYPTDRGARTMVSDFEHPELYRAYPDLRDVGLNVVDMPGSQRGWYTTPATKAPGDFDFYDNGERIGLRPTADRIQARSTMLHELQHAVQQREGFAPGSSPEAMRTLTQVGEDARLLAELGSGYEFKRATGRDPHPAARTLVAQMTPEELAQIERDPYNAYRRVAGEVEARNVQTRSDATPEDRRRVPPWRTEDVPREKQLIGASHDPATIASDAAERPPAASAEGVGSGGGGSGGNAGLPEAQAAAARWAGERKPLEGLPGPLKIGDEHFVPGPIGKIHDVAEDYMRTHHPDRPYTPPTRYHQLDPEHSKAIAQAYEEMQHTPNDPATRASYDALIKETADQYQAIKKTGLKIEPIEPGMEDPYAANPRLAAKDVAENNHLWYFPTESGFGTVNKISDNPMLRKTGEKIGDRELLANDMFRIVHDYFGHLKEGHGFRAAGEDNAWRTHSAMYSDIARPAMTTETRGQNSAVNYSHRPLHEVIGEKRARELYGDAGRWKSITVGEHNRKASAADTIYADQKVGLMPEWVMRDRNSPAPIMVYHGTPHSFDRFDISKIGQGEGNQAYGHGLYFAGHEPVSEWYRHQLATRQDPLLQKYGLQEVGHVMGSHLSDVGGRAEELIPKYAAERDKLIRSGADDKATANMIDEYDRRIRYLEDPQRSRGHLYQVGMNVNPDHLLDYDVGFNQQTPHVQGRAGPDMESSIRDQISAINRLLDKGGTGTPGTRSFRPYTSFKKQDLEGRLLMLEQAGPGALQGSEIYQRMGLPAKDRAEAAVRASQRLRDVDVPGMRYRDAGSRAPGQQGSHNYVMFGDEPLQIHRKYKRGGKVERALRQAAAWSGAGDLTGLGTVGTHTFPELMNERIMFTAKMRGESPKKVLDDFINKRKPLLSIGAAGAAAPVVGKMMDDQQRADGGRVAGALELARSIKRAKGGKVHVGAIVGHTDGRADEVPMEVPDGAYVLTADHVSSMGEGNTLAGFKKLDKMFPKSAAAHRVRKVVKRARGGGVPIYAADGEYVIHPEDITDRWGDLDAGHRYLDAWQTSSRKEHVNTLRNLAPPATD